ncbi:MAG: HAD family hydrolase, partial [Lachnospiraceae bacterium]|nr:HAD family hydrolase [Lachnospiraceae bacterium]
MKYQNYIFDLYGTLVDIRTDEESSMLWEWMAIELQEKYNTFTNGTKLQEDYLRMVKEEEEVLAAQNGSAYPEIQIEKVWNRILDGSCSMEDTKKVCQTFREMSRARLEVYPGVQEVFGAIRAAGGRIFLLSNAQWIFTEAELRMCGLRDSFDDIFISSDLGIKKPDRDFLRKLMEKHNLDVQDTVMIGNEVKADVGIATAVGMDAIYLNTYGHSMGEIKNELLACNASLEHVVVAKNGD